jgi:hypothetical protein
MPLGCTEANLNKYIKESTSLQPDTQAAQQEKQEIKHISHTLDRPMKSDASEVIPIVIPIVVRIVIPIVVRIVIPIVLPIFLECRP